VPTVSVRGAYDGKATQPPAGRSAPDPCPYCGHGHPWDNDTDSYPSCTVNVTTGPDLNGVERQVALYCCAECDAVIGVVVVEAAGSSLYIPPGDEWNNAHGY
jgi:hypothetical protein